MIRACTSSRCASRGCASVATLPEMRRYTGCVSWVKLDEDVDVSGATPVARRRDLRGATRRDRGRTRRIALAHRRSNVSARVIWCARLALSPQLASVHGSTRRTQERGLSPPRHAHHPRRDRDLPVCRGGAFLQSRVPRLRGQLSGLLPDHPRLRRHWRRLRARESWIESRVGDLGQADRARHARPVRRLVFLPLLRSRTRGRGPPLSAHAHAPTQVRALVRPRAHRALVWAPLAGCDRSSLGSPIRAALLADHIVLRGVSALGIRVDGALARRRASPAHSAEEARVRHSEARAAYVRASFRHFIARRGGGVRLLGSVSPVDDLPRAGRVRSHPRGDRRIHVRALRVRALGVVAMVQARRRIRWETPWRRRSVRARLHGIAVVHDRSRALRALRCERWKPGGRGARPADVRRVLLRRSSFAAKSGSSRGAPSRSARASRSAMLRQRRVERREARVLRVPARGRARAHCARPRCLPARARSSPAAHIAAPAASAPMPPRCRAGAAHPPRDATRAARSRTRTEARDRRHPPRPRGRKSRSPSRARPSFSYAFASST